MLFGRKLVFLFYLDTAIMFSALLLVCSLVVLSQTVDAKKSYRIVSGSFNFNQAKEACTKEGGVIAIQKSDEDHAMMKALNLDIKQGYWLGGDCEVVDKTWVGVDGVPLTKT